MFYQIFLSPQVERCAIIIYKHGIYELLHELPNEILGKGLRKLGNIRKVSKPSRMIGQCLAPCTNENFVNTSKKLPKNSN